jgi:subtilisin-like proprotein convertase family protein
MDARNTVQRISAILVIVVGTCGGAVYAGPVYVYRSDFNLRIPANPDKTRGWMADAVIEVPDHHIIYDIDVGINLTHTSVFDLQIFLQSPARKRLCLNTYSPYNEYFEGTNYIRTIFDDEAQVAIERGLPPFTGRFKPKAGRALEIFDGRDSFGLWRLQIHDAFYTDTGTLDSFELRITTPEPATVVLLLLGAGLMRLHKPRCNRKNI